MCGVGGSFNTPEGRIEPSAFFDEDAEAVRLKHLEEQREETEITEKALHDKPLPISAGIEVQEESTTTDKPVAFAPEGGIFNDDEPAGELVQHAFCWCCLWTLFLFSCASRRCCN